MSDRQQLQALKQALSAMTLTHSFAEEELQLVRERICQCEDRLLQQERLSKQRQQMQRGVLREEQQRIDTRTRVLAKLDASGVFAQDPDLARCLLREQSVLRDKFQELATVVVRSEDLGALEKIESMLASARNAPVSSVQAAKVRASS
jgi:hypothetical protein